MELDKILSYITTQMVTEEQVDITLEQSDI